MCVFVKIILKKLAGESSKVIYGSHIAEKLKILAIYMLE